MAIIGLIPFVGVVVFGLLFAIAVLKGGSLKLPTIGMAASFVLTAAVAALIQFGIGPFGDGTADEGPEPSPEASQDVGGENEGGDGIGNLDAIGEIDVNSGLFNVTLTIPSDYLDEGITQEQLNNTAKENGFKSATLNDDGSVTYVITKAQHKEMMDGIRQSVDDSLNELAESEDAPNIVKIEANSDYTQYKVVLKSESVSLVDSFTTLALYFNSGMYHVFNMTISCRSIGNYKLNPSA